MQRNLKWKYLLIIVIIGLAAWRGFLGLSAYWAKPQTEEQQKIVDMQKLSLGLDLRGGMYLVLEVDTSGLPEEAKRDATARAIEVIRNRIDQFGVREPYIHRQGRNRIVVQLPGITDRERALDLIGKTALLEFKLVSDDSDKLKEALDGNVPEGYELKYSKDEEEPLLVEAEASVTGDMLKTANVKFDQSKFNEPIVSLELNSKGARRFSRVTGENVGKRLAIVLDGEVYLAPRINERIPSGQAVITGRFSQNEAADIAIVLRAGALPAPIRIEEERTVGPTLGKDSIRKGVRAIVIGGILVFVFMIGYYFLSGMIADIALVLNLIILVGVLSYLHASLTLPGLAGIALTLGMAVDANVLINERIREEIRFGKHIRSAINSGYKRAFITIFDSNITTLITAIILFWFGTGPVRGFATTLSIGIIASMFTAIFVTRAIFDTISLSKGFTKLHMIRILKDTNIDFVKLRKFCYVLSLAAIIVGMVVFAMRGKKNFGIEFTGGTLQQFNFASPLTTQEIRTSLTEIGLRDAAIQEFSGGKDYVIRTTEDRTKEIEQKFSDAFQDNKFELSRVEKIGPIIGKELTRQALYAIFFALIGICIYVGYRFEFKWAVAAIVALFHDTLICLGALAITGREMSLPVLAALLTMIGYSINDSIVVFDRIREDLKLMRKADLKTVINASINQTLQRSLLTSFTTLLVVLSIFFLGGEVIHDFAFIFLVGVITGTYSSIFVASPIIVDWPGRKRR